MTNEDLPAGEMNFRTATRNDAEAVFALYQSVKGRGFCVWDEDYPGRGEIEQDLSAGDLFVLEEAGELVGAISIAPENELDDAAPWRLTGRVGEFTRVALRPDRQGKGLAKILVSNVLSVMKERGYEIAHLSVASGNLPAQKAYCGLGFRTVGQKELWGHLYELCERELK